MKFYHSFLVRYFSSQNQTGPEQMLEAEMEEHLGYEKNSIADNNFGNSRNGYGKKIIISDHGACEIAVPRDRNGEFEPKVLARRQTRTDEIEQKIKAMYAKGMSQRDIEDTLWDIYGPEISQGMISRSTDKILPEVNEWQPCKQSSKKGQISPGSIPGWEKVFATKYTSGRN